MTIEGTVRALAELSEIDHCLSGAGEREDRVARTLESRRAALRESIAGNFLAAYDDLGRAGRRPAVVPLVRGAHCGGCHMRVPPQLGVFVRRGQSVCSCPHCRRLLFAPVAAIETRGASLPASDDARGGPAVKHASASRGRPKKPRPS
jgi:predicted  nucleic acid-binding Zn-ribbon protein